MKEALKCLFYLLLSFYLWKIIQLSPTANTWSGNTVPPVLTVPRIVQPAPQINSPRLEKPEQGVTEVIIEYLNGPCDPIIPLFIESHNLKAVRPLIGQVINERHKGSFNPGEVCDIFDYLMAHWSKLDDPVGKELVLDAAIVWAAPEGDCDDFSVALSAALSSVGGVTCVTLSHHPVKGGHAYVEICLGNYPEIPRVEEYIRARYDLPEDTPINIRTDDSDMKYLNLDWSATHPGGPLFGAAHGVLFWPGINYCCAF